MKKTTSSPHRADFLVKEKLYTDWKAISITDKNKAE